MIGVTMVCIGCAASLPASPQPELTAWSRGWRDGYCAACRTDAA